MDEEVTDVADINIELSDDAGLLNEMNGCASDNMIKFTRMQEMIDEQKKTIALLEKENSILRDTEGKRKETIQRLEDDVAKLKTALEADDGESGCTVSNKKRKLGEMMERQENEHLQKQVENLTERLGERENELHETREKLAESEWMEQSPKEIGAIAICSKLETFIDRRMNHIDEKLANLENKQMEGKKEVKLSFANAVSKNLDNAAVTSVIQESKNTERVIESERMKREKNIIIFGATETPVKTATGEDNDTDDKFIARLIQTI